VEWATTLALATALAATTAFPAGAQERAPAAKKPAAGASTKDPRVGLKTGLTDAGVAAKTLQLLGHHDKSSGFFDSADPGNFAFANADLTFSGNFAFQGGYNGFQVWDLSNPSSPTLRKSFVCPGGQGDLSIWGNLLFMSVEDTRGRIDCGTQGVPDTVSAERFRGVRIFDVTNLDAPKQVAAVQTCRGSHTHTLVTDPNDPANIYVYVSGTSVVRSPNELAGCSGKRPEEDPNTSLFRIEVIKVPLASPQDAKIVNMPRIFADAQGNVAGLAKEGAHGPGTQTTSETNMCHDITVFPELGIAAGACAGNGILLDVKDPANPKRTIEVSDPNFAYWHSATFNNDGTSLIFTDEWGGGTAPRCRATDDPKWGADAIFTLQGGKLDLKGYFKLPAAQTEAENCVAHNGSLIPVPGRDLFVQAWYQGGITLVDFTDPAHPKEIGYFDRGPVAEKPTLGGYWSAYWYNGHVVGSEIARGIDVFDLKPGKDLSQNEIDAATLVKLDRFNPQLQSKVTWPASFVVARAYLDQLSRSKGLRADRLAHVTRDLNRAESMTGARRQAALSELSTYVANEAARAADGERVRALAAAITQLAAAGG
jgi:hypothetical protein